MPLNHFNAFVLSPNRSGATSIQITKAAPTTIASVTVNGTGSTDVLLDATVGWRCSPGDDQTVIFRIHRGSANGPLIYRSRESQENFDTVNEFDITSFSHNDSAPGNGTVSYFLTAQLAQESDSPTSTVVGPITFAASAIS